LLGTGEVNCKGALILTGAKSEHGDVGEGRNHHEVSEGREENRHEEVAQTRKLILHDLPRRIYWRTYVSYILKVKLILMYIYVYIYIYIYIYIHVFDLLAFAFSLEWVHVRASERHRQREGEERRKHWGVSGRFLSARSF